MISTSLCGLVILGTDTLIATALFHTCGHFKILQEKIKNMNTKIDFVSIVILQRSFYHHYDYDKLTHLRWLWWVTPTDILRLTYFFYFIQIQHVHNKENSVQKVKLQIIHIIKHHYTVLR